MTLSEEHIAIIKATAPVVGQHAVTITQNFYKRMLTGNPEVLQFFNAANQKSARQPQALADAVVAYALNIDNLGQLGEAVQRMVHKHVALQIKPQHYAIVARHLMDAIAEVLGDALTEDIKKAWAAAVQQLAEILISAEAQLYSELAQAPGGWEGFRVFRVSERTEGGNLVFFQLQPVDGKAVLVPRSGSYLTIHLEPEVVQPGGPRYVAPRHYSVLKADSKLGYTICVRRVPGGLYSNFLHDKVLVGQELKISPPVGPFTLTNNDAAEEVALVSAGVGFTPMVSMRQKGSWWFHVCHDDSEAELVAHKVAEFAQPPDFIQVTTKEGRPTAETVETLLNSASAHAKDKLFMICGPPAFIRSFAHGLMKLGVPHFRIRYETFGPHMQMCPAAVSIK